MIDARGNIWRNKILVCPRKFILTVAKNMRQNGARLTARRLSGSRLWRRLAEDDLPVHGDDLT